MSIERIEPTKYVDEWSQGVTIRVPNKGQTASAREALQAHVLLLYSNPLAKHLTARERDRQVREQLALYGQLLETYGFTKTLVKLKGVAHEFLRGFRSDSGQLSYEQPENMVYTPMGRSASTLANRPVDLKGPDRELIQYIFSWLSFLGKVPMDRPDLVGPAKIAWIDRQENPLPFTASRDVILEVRNIVTWLFDFEPTFVGNHGPGSTSVGAKTVPEKNRNYQPTIQTVQLTKFHVAEVPSHQCVRLFKRRPAVWQDVPKDVGSVRPITKEPPETQFAQQGLKFDIYRKVDELRDIPMSHFVRFSDQAPSQRCAVRGSRISRNRFKPATIDSSAASDHLLVEVVTELFTGNILHYLLVGRSTEVKVGKRLIDVAMYGGMGSALTFPVLTLVMLALTIHATLSQLYRDQYGVEHTPGELLEEYLDSEGFKPHIKFLLNSIRVYGDDIAVPDFAAERLVNLLGTFGLKVNVDKSFIGDSPVRESCGVYALGGYDITPKRYSLPSHEGTLDGALFEATRMLANVAFGMGWKYLNRALIRRVRRIKMFMSTKEAGRRLRRGKQTGYPDQEIRDADLLFEEWRGVDDYIGFCSNRGSEATHVLSLHERVPSFTTYFVETDAAIDRENEFYHLTVNYRGMSKPVDRNSTEAHGSVPRGIRIVKRNAIHVANHDVSGSVVWGWAPR